MFIKPYLKFLIILLMLFLFSGCPYTSKIPLNSAESAFIDDSLLGSWANQEEEADSSEILHILPFNTHEYLILFLEKGESSIFRAFSKSINKSSFLSLTEIHPGVQKEVNYIFACYAVHGNSLKIRLIEEKLFNNQEFENPDQLSEFIKTQLNNEELYDEAQFLIRVKDSKLIR